MSHPTGKGIYIWQLQNCGFGTNMVGLVADLVTAKVNHVAVKRHDGTSLTYDPNHVALVAPFIAACLTANIEVWLWGYTYGVSNANAENEANAAVQSLNLHPQAKGYIIDAEGEYKNTAGPGWATAFVNEFRALKPLIPLGLSSFRFPSLHKEFPFAQFLVKCDFHYPQMYWVQNNNPAAQLTQSHNELKALKNIPYIPAGCGYCFGGWCPTGPQWTEFDTQAKALNLPGISGWSLQHIRTISAVWATYKGLTWGITPPPPPDPDPDPEYVTWEEFEALAALVENLTAITPTHIISGAGSNGEKFRATPGGNERWMVPNGREVRWVTENATSVLCEMVYRGRVELGWVDKENLTPL